MIALAVRGDHQFVSTDQGRLLGKDLHNLGKAVNSLRGSTKTNAVLDDVGDIPLLDAVRNHTMSVLNPRVTHALSLAVKED
jgi:hypothetical protein